MSRGAQKSRSAKILTVIAYLRTWQCGRANISERVGVFDSKWEPRRGQKHMNRWYVWESQNFCRTVFVPRTKALERTGKLGGQAQGGAPPRCGIEFAGDVAQI
ncbi:hypothetical protein EJ04DRAFT_509708 [Polyplosphaeria fusca]|uniref:Uncharacterized protein n=1 Tax=Polyplosphaeria fusca TaxID=682080 RepID=A0A9P4R7K5_9PLEO|nr:hypothetical protein EJ04DRAFT_509708 [Polyplosphaeria fusca]